MKKVILVVLSLLLSTVANAEPPGVRLSDFQQLSYPMKDPQFYGNTYLPKWSKTDRFVGASFSDPVKEKRFVVIYDLESSRTLKYDTSMKGGQGAKRDPFARRRPSNDTHLLQWSPAKEGTFYVISRVDKMDYLYKVEMTGSSSGISIQNTELVKTDKVPVTNFIISNMTPRKERYYLLVNIGTEGAYDINIFNVRNTIRPLPFKSTKSIDEYEGQIFIEGRDQHIIIQGKINDQMDVFSFHRKSAREQSEIVNLTKSERYNEKIPRFNPSGSRLAFLRSEKIGSNDKNKEQFLNYSLIVYDFAGQTEKVLHKNVFVIPDVSLQNPYIWVSDEAIIFVENNFNHRFPLRVVDVTTGESIEIKTPYVNHKDLALSSKGNKIAFVAKGKQETDDLAFDKVFICNLKIY